MFTPDPTDFKLRDVIRRSEDYVQPDDVAGQLVTARADIRHLLTLVADLDEQLTEALNPAWDDDE